MTSVLESTKTFIKTYTDQYGAEGAPLWTNYLGPNPTQYSIVPIANPRTVETYLNGIKKREFAFALQSVEFTAEEMNRIQNEEFYEAFADWLDEQTEAGNLPVMNANQTPEKIEALDSGFLFAQGESGTGIYQIQCKLTYYQGV